MRGTGRGVWTELLKELEGGDSAGGRGRGAMAGFSLSGETVDSASSESREEGMILKERLFAAQCKTANSQKGSRVMGRMGMEEPRLVHPLPFLGWELADLE